MSKRLATVAGARRALPSLILLATVAAALLVSVAQAEDPPIASVGHVGAGGNTASGAVGGGGQADACVNDQSSAVDPSSQSTDGAATVNSGTCTSGTSASTSTGSTGSGSTRSTARAGSAKTGAAAWVSSSEAVGLRIVRVRQVTTGVSVTKRFRVLVTLRDLRGRYVRHAIVSVGRVPGASNTVSGVHSTFTNKVGRASIRVPVTRSMLGARLFLKIGARTPSSRSVVLRSVRLPAFG